jgi:hypothetical protein
MTQNPNPQNSQTHFKFTASRRDILTLLVRYANLTTNDFYRLLPPPSPERQDSHHRDTRRTLRDFANRGYLVRRRWFDDERDDTPFPAVVSVYGLSKEGLRLAREKGIANGTGKHAEDSSRRNESVGHELEITRFHIAIDSLPRKVLWRQNDLRRGVNPDALFAVAQQDGESAYYYFLEIEKSKLGHYEEGESGLMKQLARYYEYQGSDECRRDWKHFDRFRVIVILKNEQRRRNLLKALAQRYKTRTFWVTTEAHYRQNPAGLIFLTPKDHEANSYSFLDN